MADEDKPQAPVETEAVKQDEVAESLSGDEPPQDTNTEVVAEETPAETEATTEETEEPKTADTPVEDDASNADSQSDEATADEPAAATEDTTEDEAGEQSIAEAAEAEEAPKSIAEEAAADTDESKPQKESTNGPAKGLSMAIVIAILVALALIGLGYSAFLSENDEPETDSQLTSQPAVEQTDEVQPVESAEEVTSEIDEITSEIESLTDDTDFSDDGLSDENLGL